MILVDMTIVSVATPAILETYAPHGATVNDVIWVTSAYLLAYAVPILITGRLGDRIGPKRMYLGGLVVFTVASLWCGLSFALSTSIWMLVAARVLQGFGAAAVAPQTMAVITRIFPRESRGSAMSLWGATAGVATLVGPLLGGVLVDAAGWEWIFFINIPIGVVGLWLAWRLVPDLGVHEHSFDWLGVALSGVALLLLVFGIQEGHALDWNGTIIAMILGGLVVGAVFVWWQAKNTREPLMPLPLFRDRNFSLANVAIASVGFVFASMGFPLMLWAQLVRGDSPTQAGLLFAPMAVMSIVLAPLAGKLTDRVHPRILAGAGLAGVAVSLVLLASAIGPDTPLWQVLGAMALLGIGSSFVWAPLTTTANRNLPLHQAGAGSGIYNANRQVGSVVGAAAIAVLIDSRLAANGLGGGGGTSEASLGGTLPDAVHGAFSTAMSQAMFLLPAVLLVGLVAVVFFERPGHFGAAPAEPAPPAAH
ncbi:DHA2 family efflux MFS transporter permease subunit [Nocardioides KLBMP 9356]|uniref:DHA2 family efflux MFS transporter permease subunit n=2 Tax=Nocardioides potassii TaxID=2911371 RepID=A0ABS9H777_9ACTN|nr:DHA2 family efflux MFS transporter permease subunit [Nocardioides potassii]